MKGKAAMIQLHNPDLSNVLQKTKLNFYWDAFTRTWQLEKKFNGNVWRSVMYLAHDQVEAEKEAIAHINRFYSNR
jgi:hypothetical protein